jgi:hypothetical protein
MMMRKRDKDEEQRGRWRTRRRRLLLHLRGAPPVVGKILSGEGRLGLRVMEVRYLRRRIRPDDVILTPVLHQ